MPVSRVEFVSVFLVVVWRDFKSRVGIPTVLVLIIILVVVVVVVV